MSDDIKQELTNKELEEQKSSSGVIVASGEIEHGDYDTKNWQELIKDYTEMRNGDPIVGATLSILKYPALNAERIIKSGRDTEESKEAAEFVDWTFDNIYKGFEYVKYHKLLSVDFGISVNEKVWDRGVEWNGKLTNQLAKLAPMMPETLYKFLYDEETNFIGIEHEKKIPDGGSSFVTIPNSKLDILTYNEEFNDIRGRALLRPARLAYNSKFKIIISTVTTTQRGAGIPYIEVDGDVKTQQSEVQQLARSISLGQNSYVAVNKNAMTASLLEPRNQADRIPFVEYLDRQLFFNALSQFMTAGIGGNGSRAATQELKAPYELAVGYLMKLTEDSFQDIVNLIIENSHLANIEKEDIPIFKFSAFTQPDLNKVAQQLQILYGTNIVNKREGDEEMIREFFNLPTTIKQQVDNASDDNKTDVTDITDDKTDDDLDNDKTELTKTKVKIPVKSEIDFNHFINKTYNEAYNQLHDKGEIISLSVERELINKLNNTYVKNYCEAADKSIIKLSKELEKDSSSIFHINKSKVTNKKVIGESVNSLYHDIAEGFKKIYAYVYPENKERYELEKKVKELFSAKMIDFHKIIRSGKDDGQNKILQLNKKKPLVNIKLTHDNNCDCGCSSDNNKLELIKFNLKPHRELTRIELDILELDSANDFYLTIQDKEQEIINDVLEKTKNDAAEQIKNNGEVKELIGKEELTSRLNALYKEGFDTGSSDVSKELKKIGNGDFLPVDNNVDNKKSIERWVGKLFNSMEVVLEDEIENASPEKIKDTDFIEGLVLILISGFINDKRNVFQQVEKGFIDGRGETLSQLEQDIETVTYSAILDGNVCFVCEPLDGLELTLQEVRERGLQFFKPTNPGCEGRQRCRCLLIPTSVKNQ